MTRVVKKKSSYKLYKIIEWILNVLLVILTIVICIGFFYIYQIKILKNDYANLFGYTFFEVATGSMYPTLDIGDVIIVELTKNVKENDIIVYKDEENIITHRLIKKNMDGLIAKGDANNSEDKPIQEEMVLGKVINTINKLGVWRKILISKEVVGLIMLLIALISAMFMFSSKTEESNDK